jgi:hypothetical protein
MNEATAIRQASARRVGGRWAAEPGVIAVLLVGSSVEETCDEASDVDMCVYWAQPPARGALESVKAEFGTGERFFFFGEPEQGGCVESYRIGGIRHDFAHSTLEMWEAQTEDALGKLNLDSPWQKGLHGTLHGQVLHGAEVVEGLRQRIAPYPEALRLAMLGRYCSFTPRWTIQRQAQQRGDRLFYFELLTKLQTNLLYTLCAVNGVYHAMEFKRLHRFVAQEFSQAPPDLAARLDALFAAPAEEFPDDLPALVAETLALVEAHCPQFDTAPVRKRWELVS